jgi:hypothetical protein
LVSLTESAISCFSAKKNPPPDALWRWVMSADEP